MDAHSLIESLHLEETTLNRPMMRPFKSDKSFVAYFHGSRRRGIQEVTVTSLGVTQYHTSLFGSDPIGDDDLRTIT